jgi:phosphopantothenoylcysteine decarboxylase/phosphopantothenate--cysteine ligase
MGKALAEEALARGARVTVIQGMDKGICLPVDRQQTGRLTVVPVETAEEMREQALRHLAAATGVIATAAVLDYRVKDPSASKVKRNQESVTLELEPSADVLQALRQAAGSDQWFLGFAAETDAVLENGKLKLDRKRLDWLFANAVARTGETTPTGFGSTQNAGVLLSRTGEALSISLASKHQVAGQILNEISNQLSRARPNSHPAPGVSAP